MGFGLTLRQGFRRLFCRRMMESSASVSRIEVKPKRFSDSMGPLPIVVCGPSGVGKSTLVQRLTGEFNDDFGFSVSHTTRKPRPGEVDGVHYHFSTHEVMRPLIDSGGFVESATVHTNLYGTSKAAVVDVRRSGRICILDIDIQGVKTCQSTDFPVALYIFIAPPSIEILEARLRGRGTETEDSLRTRITNAYKEVDAAKTTRFDLWIVNDDLDTAYAGLKAGLLPLIESRREWAAAAGVGAK